MQDKNSEINNRTTIYARWIVQNRWTVIALSLLFVLAITSGIRNAGFTGDYHVFFTDDNPQMLAFERLENTYTKDDNVLIVLAPKSGNVFNKQTLQAVEDITRMGWQVPFSSRVDSISNFQYTHANDDDLIVEDLYQGAASLSEQDIQTIRRVALNEPLLVNRIISSEGHVTGINITVQLPGISPETEMPQITTAVNGIADQIRQQYPQIDVHMTGIVLLNNAFFSSSMKDMATLVPLTFLVILIAVGLFLRSWTSTFSTLWIIVFSIMVGMGFSGWAGIKLTPPSSVAPTIIMTLAVANAIHILVSMFHAMRIGEQKQDAIVESLRVNMQPVFLTSLSTVIGFLCMNFSESPPFHDLGNIVAVGMGASFFLSITFLPALMAILPVRVPKPKLDDNSAMLRLAEFVIRRRTSLLIGMSLIVLTLGSFLPRNNLGENFVEYFDKSIPFRTASDFVSDNLGGMYRIDYSVKSYGPGGISAPQFLNRLEAFSNWYQQQPEVIHVSTLTDTMKRLNKNMHADSEDFYILPGERNLSAQYLLLYEMSLPYGLDLNNQINVDKSATRMSVTIKNINTTKILALEERAQAWLQQNGAEIQSDGSSTTIMFSHIGKRNIKSMIIGTTVALVLISFILIFALRSIKIGLISLVPNLVPATMGFGLWGLMVSEINVGLSIVTGMTLGIVVDDTVHFLSKYLRARREKGLDVEQAVRYAFSTVGTALWVTSAVLISGFMILTLSTFKLNSDMGLLTSIVIAFALIADFLFLPALLMKLDAKKKIPVINTDPVTETT
ncbi:efflux RND transporter permease subunit [Sulfuriflexus mobilis]|uniref:efflux RND transporter permease subunit n=1 Tax=Sulfuriflexus mobilis TaxID=1811807 RepID=UPI000F81F918|nr:efflux RND transporter permease subunit [Sulfuriflexus mobilis]